MFQTACAVRSSRCPHLFSPRVVCFDRCSVADGCSDRIHQWQKAYWRLSAASRLLPTRASVSFAGSGYVCRTQTVRSPSNAPRRLQRPTRVFQRRSCLPFATASCSSTSTAERLKSASRLLQDYPQQTNATRSRITSSVPRSFFCLSLFRHCWTSPPGEIRTVSPNV